MSKSAGADGPLSGVRVLDLTSVIFGSYATCILGDLGADVIKIEQPKSRTGGSGGDIMRWGGTPPKSAKAGLGPVFLTINRNKRSVVLDLTTEFGMQALLELVKTADIFASNIRSSALEKLGLSYEALATIKQDLIYIHASGFGRGGAYEGQAAYDDIIQSLSGFADLLSASDGDPKPRFIPPCSWLMPPWPPFIIGSRAGSASSSRFRCSKR
jgi:crotonobetainyl-CoA:carnitine CoA-transferase CaiB-like acyl-CoA transferase